MTDLVAAFSKVSVPTVIACLTKFGMQTRHFTGLKPIGPGQPKICGPAFTVRTVPIREDIRNATNAGKLPNLHRQAMAAAGPGQVIVFDAGNSPGVSPLGDIIALALKQRGINGFIADSGAGDIPGIVEVGFPVFCYGSAPVPGSTKISVAEWNVPIGCAGVAVYPGDFILGDDTGAVCIPADIAAEVAEMALKQETMETFLVERIRAGFPLETTYPPNAETLAAFEAWKQAR